jgi:hypothetical protein
MERKGLFHLGHLIKPLTARPGSGRQAGKNGRYVGREDLIAIIEETGLGSF